MVGRGGEQTHPKFLASKKKCKRKSSQNHENPFGVGVVLYLNFDFTVHFLDFDSIFLQGFQKKGGGATPW